MHVGFQIFVGVKRGELFRSSNHHEGLSEGIRRYDFVFGLKKLILGCHFSDASVVVIEKAGVVGGRSFECAY